ncbi:hypothetical protein R1sor_015835 [Riccia sorocarpa]|uniref:High-affinity nitrate transporter n=1 Tax=Riccia sorocarpa TaxID=122646 RepID=A0ABD3HFA3_9MARC
MASLQRLVVTVIMVITLATGVRNVEGVLFSSLTRTLTVIAQIQSENASAGAATVGVDSVSIDWSLDSTIPSKVGENYAYVKLELCFAPVSQIDRDWRNTYDDLDKDKTCFRELTTQRYRNAGDSFVWRIPKNVPGAYYFVRAYALTVTGVEVGYGQSTDDEKNSNLIRIIPITGRLRVMDFAGILFSLLSVVSLFLVLAKEARAQAFSGIRIFPIDLTVVPNVRGI